AIASGAGALAEAGEEQLDLGVSGRFFEGGELYGRVEQLAKQTIDANDLAEKGDPVGLLMKHLMGNPLGGMLAIFMSDRGCNGHFHSAGSFQSGHESGKSKQTHPLVGCDFPKTTDAVKSSMNVLALLALTTTAPGLLKSWHCCPSG